MTEKNGYKLNWHAREAEYIRKQEYISFSDKIKIFAVYNIIFDVFLQPQKNILFTRMY